MATAHLQNGHAQLNEVRAYWDRRPCNIRHSRQVVGTKEYFDEVEARKYFVEPHIPGFAEFAKWSGKKVLEIGCGIGTDAINFARAGADYTAIEISKESLELTRKRFAAYGLTGTFYEGNAEDVLSIVPVQQYDLVYSFGVIHHTPRPERVIDGVRHYMGPHSEFRLMMYAKNSWKAFMIDAGMDQPEAQSGCPIAFTYTPDELRNLLKGFFVVDIHQDHVFPYVVEKYVRYEYELQPWFKAMPPEMFRALERNLGWHALVRCKLATT
jgi:2-polyprenyl-3-methyl-5-hydroxy-6-metoxy-1,4-benzoquinol methylase